MDAIQIKGQEFLTSEELAEANRILGAGYEKLKRLLKGDFSLKASIKVYNKDGKKKKYSVNAQIIASTQPFEASAMDWEFNKALHEAVNKLQTEIEHRFHVSEQGKE